MAHVRVLVWLSFCLMASACMPKSVSTFLRNPPDYLPSQVQLHGIPFVAQTGEFCGPASLAMILGFYGQEADLEQLGLEVFVPALGGSLQPEMSAYLRRRGLIAYKLSGGLESLFAQIANGHPVIVLQNLGLANVPFWHYSVVIGYDLERAKIILHSGQRENYSLSLKKFSYTCARGQNWALTPLPAGSFPSRPNRQQAFIDSVAFINTPGQSNYAKTHYSAALKLCPNDEAFSIALSNVFYSQDKYDQAIKVLLKATSTPTKSPLIFNNLAYNLAAKHCYASAQESVKCAVALDPSPEFLKSQIEIENLDSVGKTPKDCPIIRCD